MKEYYTYVYLDPTCEGYFGHFEGIVFNLKPFYVGKGTNNRIEDHVKMGNKHYNKHLANKIAKIHKQGRKPIGLILFSSTSEEKCFAYEEKLIRIWGRADNKTGILCNMTDGGDGVRNRVISIEERLRISKRNKGRKVSEETREKLSQSHLGVSQGPLSEEHKSKISIGMKSSLKFENAVEERKNKEYQPFSQEHCENISKSMTGVKYTEERKQNISNSLKGKEIKSTNKNYQLWDIDGVEMTTKDALIFLNLSHYRKLQQSYTSRFPNAHKYNGENIQMSENNLAINEEKILSKSVSVYSNGSLDIEETEIQVVREFLDFTPIIKKYQQE